MITRPNTRSTYLDFVFAVFEISLSLTSLLWVRRQTWPPCWRQMPLSSCQDSLSARQNGRMVGWGSLCLKSGMVTQAVLFLIAKKRP